MPETVEVSVEAAVATPTIRLVAVGEFVRSAVTFAAPASFCTGSPALIEAVVPEATTYGMPPPVANAEAVSAGWISPFAISLSIFLLVRRQIAS